MRRRDLLIGLGGVLAPLALRRARAASTVLGPATPLGVPTRAFVEHPEIVRQNCPLWCWAASASMIFAAHGHPVEQSRIVQRVFNGLLVCAGSSNTLTIAQVLSATWVDDHNRSFQARVAAAYDPMNGIVLIDNGFIAAELEQNRPLLYCNTHHAMVVTAIEYFATPAGNNVQAVGVLDPWPLSPAFHPLSPPEIVQSRLGGEMTFLAAVHVT